MKSKAGDSVYGGTGVLLEHHRHFPLNEDTVAFFGDAWHMHLQLLTPVGQPLAQGFEVLKSADFLYAVFEGHIFVVVREDVRLVGLAFAVVGPGPELSHLVR